MVARRKQKKQPIKTLELITIQYALGYGAYPARLAATWILVAFACGILLALVTGQGQNLALGFAAAFVPGYALSHAQLGAAEWVAAAETVLAAFLWAAFIAVFARKYLD